MICPHALSGLPRRCRLTYRLHNIVYLGPIGWFWTHNHIRLYSFFKKNFLLLLLTFYFFSSLLSSSSSVAKHPGVTMLTRVWSRSEQVCKADQLVSGTADYASLTWRLNAAPPPRFNCLIQIASRFLASWSELDTEMISSKLHKRSNTTML